MGRTNIAVDNKIARGIADQASKQGKTIYGLTNEMLDACLRIAQSGGDSKRVLNLWNLSTIMKDLDFIPVPGEFFEWIIQMIYNDNKEVLMNKAREYGEATGKSLSILCPDFIELIKQYTDVLERVLPIKRLEVTNSNEGYIMKIVGAGKSIETTDVVNKIIEGIMASYEKLKVCRCEMAKGILEIEVKVYPV